MRTAAAVEGIRIVAAVEASWGQIQRVGRSISMDHCLDFQVGLEPVEVEEVVELQHYQNLRMGFRSFSKVKI